MFTNSAVMGYQTKNTHIHYISWVCVVVRFRANYPVHSDCISAFVHIIQLH